MADLIDRAAALDMELTVECGLGELEPLMRGMNLVFQHIKELPAADVATVRRGRWELDVLDGTPGYRPVCLVCSECHRISCAGFPYCPNCGAHMTEGEQDG